jgi:hypothetical protein
MIDSLAFQVFFTSGAILALVGALLWIASLVAVTEFVDPPYVARHARSDEEILSMLEFETTVDLFTLTAEPISVGRHARESLVKVMPVDSEWAPPIGDVRIALLETPTAEYLFARRPKDQLDTSRLVRAYAYSE